MPSDDRRGNFKKPTSQRSDNNRDTSSRYGNNGERQQSRNDCDDDGQQRNRSSNQNRQNYSKNGNSNQYRNQSRNNPDYDNRQYNNNSMSSYFQNGQGYNSRGNQNYGGFSQHSSYRFQNNGRDLDQSSSQSDIYTKCLQLQVRMLTQASSLQNPSINSDEFNASQSCSSNLSQLGYIQSTPSSVTTCPVVAPQGPGSSNELGDQQGPTSSREELPLTPSLSPSLTLPASEQSVATPTTNQSSTEPRFPANQSIRQNSDRITMYDRAPNHDRHPFRGFTSHRVLGI